MNDFLTFLSGLFKAPELTSASESTPRLMPIPELSHNTITLITTADYLMGRDKIAPLTDEMKADAATTVERVNKLLVLFGESRKVDSGYRPAAINAAIKNAAPHSKHMVCRACDLEDKDGKLDRWCMANQDKLAEIGLWLESPTDTPTWAHVQIVPPASGHRVFLA